MTGRLAVLAKVPLQHFLDVLLAKLPGMEKRWDRIVDCELRPQHLGVEEGRELHDDLVRE